MQVFNQTILKIRVLILIEFSLKLLYIKIRAKVRQMGEGGEGVKCHWTLNPLASFIFLFLHLEVTI